MSHLQPASLLPSSCHLSIYCQHCHLCFKLLTNVQNVQNSKHLLSTSVPLHNYYELWLLTNMFNNVKISLSNVKGFPSSNFTRLFAYIPLYFLSKGQKLLVTLIVPSKFTLIWWCMCRSVCHSNSPNIITPALFINALSSERKNMHSHFGQANRSALSLLLDD